MIGVGVKEAGNEMNEIGIETGIMIEVDEVVIVITVAQEVRRDEVIKVKEV